MSLGEAYKAFLEKENLKDEDALKKAFDYGRDFGYSELKSSLEETEFYDDCKEQEKKTWKMNLILNLMTLFHLKT